MRSHNLGVRGMTEPTKKPTRMTRERGREIIQAHLDQAQPWDRYIALPISAVRAVVEDE